MKAFKKGFTLIEVLVVLGIIAFMATGITMLSMKDTSQGILAARHSMMTAFYSAKMAAITKKAPVMLIVYKGDDITRRLRQVGIIYQVRKDGASEGWSALNEGFVMPEGVFFVPPVNDFTRFVKLGKGVKQNEVFCSTFNDIYTGSNNEVSVKTFPSITPQPVSVGRGDWYCYQFSADGLSMNPGSYVMLGVGRQNNAGMFTIDNPALQMGFVVRKLGHTIAFSGYDEMEEVINK